MAPRIGGIGVALICATFAGCSHSEPFGFVAQTVGPFSAGIDERLTFNPDQDYWPSYTEDGAGILYAYVQQGSTVRHRCIGLLPAAGGSRLWQLCDNRATNVDSNSSFPAFALGADGRLIYLESQSRSSTLNGVTQQTLWLADSAAPFARTELASFPIILSGNAYDWLGDITWTGPSTFLALAQLSGTFPDCHACGPQDTLLVDTRSAIVQGNIANGHAMFTLVAGTDGASGYSPAEGGSSIVFTKANTQTLLKVPSGGGTAAVIAIVTNDGSQQLLGVTCRGTTCLVTNAPVTLSAPDVPIFPGLRPGASEVHAISLTTGTSQLLLSSTSGQIYASPKWSPTSNDVVVQIGGVLGHLQTIASAPLSDLHLLPSIIQ